MLKKGSKYLIAFLQEKWKSDQNIMETIQLNNNELNIVKKIEDKILKKNKNNKKIVTINY